MSIQAERQIPDAENGADSDDPAYLKALWKRRIALSDEMFQPVDLRTIADGIHRDRIKAEVMGSLVDAGSDVSGPEWEGVEAADRQTILRREVTWHYAQIEALRLIVDDLQRLAVEMASRICSLENDYVANVTGVDIDSTYGEHCVAGAGVGMMLFPERLGVLAQLGRVEGVTAPWDEDDEPTQASVAESVTSGD
jgi:hypothetical protein